MRPIWFAILLLAACKKGADRPAAPAQPEAAHVLGATPRAAVADAAVATAAADAGLPKASDAKAAALAAAKNAGILGALKGGKPGAFASIFGKGDIHTGFADKDILGGLTGNQVGDPQGGYGFGKAGSGAGGTGMGTIGTGNYGTLGHGSGTGTGYGVGGGGVRRVHTSPALNLGPLGGVPDADREVVRRSLRLRMANFTYCYQKQLMVKPDLSGTLVVSFTIGQTGSVDSATASGLDPAVASCVADTTKAIQFPRPSGGEALQASVAMTFHPGT